LRLDQLSIVLRPRTPFEAMDLGIALVRRHADAIWKPWLAMTTVAFVVFNALAWAIGPVWLAAVAMWWLKPLFDRVPLYVLSRAVFGAVPAPRQALRAPQVWAIGQLAAWLTWRRLDPGRALKLPVDLLEGPRGAARGDRVRVLQQAIQSQAWGLTFVGSLLEVTLFLSSFALVLVLVSPTIEVLPDNLRLWATTFFESPPKWAQLVGNAVAWLAMSVVEPFYVGAGFGLYLNRRTQLEAWDVELAFRRLAERAQSLAGGLLMALAFALPFAAAVPAPAAAQEKTEAPAKSDKAKVPAPDDEEDCCDEPTQVTTHELAGAHWREGGEAFSRSVDRAFRDPNLTRTERHDTWRLRNRKPDEPPKPMSPWLASLGRLIAMAGEWGLWIVAGVLVAWLLWKLPAWLPWVRELRAREAPQSPIVEHADAVLEPLPDDVPGAVRALWRNGDGRGALALLYRASVERVANALGKPMPPGATEAECLRRARKLPETDHATFAQVVRAWQAAAYAHRLPDAAGFDDLMAGWTRVFGGRA
jgi:hypothetical protein